MVAGQPGRCDPGRAVPRRSQESIDRATGEIVQDSVGVKLLRLGFPSLIFRLTGSAASVSSPG